MSSLKFKLVGELGRPKSKGRRMGCTTIGCGLALLTILYGCEDPTFSDCARASELELRLLKDRSNFPGDTDPVIQKSGTEAWTAAKRWKRNVCRDALSLSE